MANTTQSDGKVQVGLGDFEALFSVGFGSVCLTILGCPAGCRYLCNAGIVAKWPVFHWHHGPVWLAFRLVVPAGAVSFGRAGPMGKRFGSRAGFRVFW